MPQYQMSAHPIIQVVDQSYLGGSARINEPLGYFMRADLLADYLHAGITHVLTTADGGLQNECTRTYEFLDRATTCLIKAYEALRKIGGYTSSREVIRAIEGVCSRCGTPIDGSLATKHPQDLLSAYFNVKLANLSGPLGLPNMSILRYELEQDIELLRDCRSAVQDLIPQVVCGGASQTQMLAA